MGLNVYSTLTRQKENFVTWEPNKVKMYCCGPTVYGLLHVGNFRGAIFYNLVRNWLEHLGYEVTYVYNFTDVDDKIIDRAREENVTSEEISEKYIQEFKKDYAALDLRPHTHNPKVTEYMESIREIVSDLIAKKKAYVVDGEVLYSIRSFDGYGKLSGRNPDDLIAGARVEVDRKKHDPLDFALWKPGKAGEPTWQSPWGAGRPGWHIECSAMAKSILGEQIDIHGGGMDLIFPHHENEVAQSEGCTGKQFVKYWMHNNMFNFGGQKMSKSLGNILTGRDFMTKYNPEILKYITLSAHYRSVAEFGDQAIELAIKGLARVYSALSVAESFVVEAQLQYPIVSGSQKPQDNANRLHSLVQAKDGNLIKKDNAFETATQEAWKQIEVALNDDFNTPEVMARIFEIVRLYNSQVKRGMKSNPTVLGKSVQFIDFVHSIGQYLSMFLKSPTEFLITLDDMLLRNMNLPRAKVESLVEERWQARLNKDFKKSDELREQLTSLGISVSDTPAGSFWEVAK